MVRSKPLHYSLSINSTTTSLLSARSSDLGLESINRDVYCVADVSSGKRQQSL